MEIKQAMELRTKRKPGEQRRDCGLNQWVPYPIPASWLSSITVRVSNQ
jgi:hypothetical protein